MRQRSAIELSVGSNSPTGGIASSSGELRPLSPHTSQTAGQTESLWRTVEELRTLVKLTRVELALERTAREKLEKEVAALKARLPAV